MTKENLIPLSFEDFKRLKPGDVIKETALNYLPYGIVHEVGISPNTGNYRVLARWGNSIEVAKKNLMIQGCSFKPHNMFLVGPKNLDEVYAEGF